MSQKLPLQTKLSLGDTLPLTCSRTGTCCHGKAVWINPWELARLARSKKVSSRQFRDDYTDFGGIRLKFNGPLGWKGLEACSQYIPDFGCSVHDGRPLACRLYPLGRLKQGDKTYYMHEGKNFPCLEGCPEVVELPGLTVAEYISGQKAEESELAQDQYLEMMQELADGAFSLLFESGLAETGDRQTLKLWRTIGNESPEKRAFRLGAEWLELLLIPEIEEGLDDAAAFTDSHFSNLQERAQESFGVLDSAESFREASGHMMALALHLGRGLGVDSGAMVDHWITTARDLGARE